VNYETLQWYDPAALNSGPWWDGGLHASPSVKKFCTPVWQNGSSWPSLRCDYYGVPFTVGPFTTDSGARFFEPPWQALKAQAVSAFKAKLLQLANAESLAGSRARQAQKNAENTSWPPASRAAAWKQSATEWLSARQSALQIGQLYLERANHPWIQASPSWDPHNAQGTGGGNVRANVYQGWSQWALVQSNAMTGLTLQNVPQQGGIQAQSLGAVTYGGYPSYGRSPW
jgi:hypothetical protein